MRVNRRSILIVSAALLATPMAVAAAPSAQAAPGIVVREIVADGPAVVNDVAAGVEVNLQFKVLANTLASFTNNVIGTTNGPGQALIQIVGPNGSPTMPATPVYSNALSSLFLTPGTWTIRLVPIDAATAVRSEVELNFYQPIVSTTTIGATKTIAVEYGQSAEFGFKVATSQKVAWRVLDAGPGALGVGMDIYNAATGAIVGPYTWLQAPDLFGINPVVLPPGRYVARLNYFGADNSLKVAVMPVL